MKKSCVTACPVEWPEGRGISGRMRVEWVAGSTWNRWSDAHGMGGQMTVESAGQPRFAVWPVKAVICRRHESAPLPPSHIVHFPEDADRVQVNRNPLGSAGLFRWPCFPGLGVGVAGQASERSAWIELHAISAYLQDGHGAVDVIEEQIGEVGFHHRLDATGPPCPAQFPAGSKILDKIGYR